MSMIMNEFTYYDDVKLWRAQLSFNLKCLGHGNSFCQAKGQGQGSATCQLLVKFTKH